MLSPTRRLFALSLVAFIPLAAETRTLTILHTNDLHARMTAMENGNGGFARLAAVIRHERAGCVDCILLNAGDLVQGSPVSTLFHGMPVFQVADLFGFDAATLGNHDFDYGWEQTRRFLKTANYPVVDANLVGRDNRTFTARPYVILKVNGLRVAVIGAMTDELGGLSTPKLLGEWHTAPVLQAARSYAEKVRSQADVVVLLAHVTQKEERQILVDAPEIPVIVTGHEHAGLSEAESRDGRVLVRVKSNGEELGRLELRVDTEKKSVTAWKWKHIPVNASAGEPAADVARQVGKWEDEVTRRVDQPLAVSKRPIGKPELRRLMEQAMREATGADFAFMNAGGVRDSLPAGQLLVRHIWNVMPFDNVLVYGRFKGKNLPAVVVGDRKIDPEREYALAVSDFTAANQSEGSQLRSKGLAFPKDSGLLRDALVDWFRKKQVIE